MKQEINRKHVSTRIITLLIVFLVIVGGLLGWYLGRSGKTVSTQPSNTNQNTTANNLNNEDVKSLVSYTLPDGWNEASCPSVPGTVYILPSGVSAVDCSANPSSPVKISVDPDNTIDCNQLQNVQNVKKHVCISLYINGHKSLKASTEYLSSSSYKQDTTVNDYYIDSGKGVIKVEYVYSTENQYQIGFDQLANSVKVKN